MRSDKRTVTLLLVIGLILVYLATYSLTAIRVSRYALEFEGRFCWRTTPSGSFFPWPRPSGFAQALSDMNSIDSFIYGFLIRTWLLPVTTVVLWIGFVILLVNISKLRVRIY